MMKTHRKGCLHILVRLFALLVAVCVAATVLCSIVFRPIYVDGESMLPTLQTGDWIVACRIAQVKRGSILVTNTQNKLHSRLIKRAVALGGDVVDFDMQTGVLTVNGEVVDEPYLSDRTPAGGDVQFPLTVPDGCVFVLGDNRSNSTDSRFGEIGCIALDDVIGPVWYRMYPLPVIDFFE